MPMGPTRYDRVIQHCAVLGQLETAVRQWKVHAPQPYGQETTSVMVSCVCPRTHRELCFVMVPDNVRYLTIMTPSGQVVYDSRVDVPCDMAQWEDTAACFRAEWPTGRLSRTGADCEKEQSMTEHDMIQAGIPLDVADQRVRLHAAVEELPAHLCAATLCLLEGAIAIVRQKETS
jgi:hypothetical protein